MVKLNEGRWLEARLADWRSRGLVSDEQADAIRRHEAGQPRGPRISFMGLLTGIGGLFIGLGVILVISYNWERIPALVRQAGFLSLLAALALARHKSTGRALAERAVDVVWVLIPLAGIGLWGQIYQLSGDSFKPLLVTLALGLPVVWCGRHTAVAGVHAGLFALAMFSGVLEEGSWISLHDADLPRSFFLLFICGVLWAGALAQVRVLAHPTFRLGLWVAFLLFVGVFAGMSDALRPEQAGVAMTMLSATVAILWAGPRIAATDESDTRSLGYVANAALLYLFSFLHHAGEDSGDGHGEADLAFMGFLVVAGVASLWTARSSEASEPATILRDRLVLLFPLAISLLAVPDVLPLHVLSYLANVALVVFCVHGMREGVARGEDGLINGSVSVLGLLIVTRFVDYFGSLLDSGAAFIAVGCLFLALAWAMNRGRQGLLARAGEGTDEGAEEEREEAEEGEGR